LIDALYTGRKGILDFVEVPELGLVVLTVGALPAAPSSPTPCKRCTR